ncbi:hypothetical protein AB9E11_35550, partial [Rhizobium leguminosarum]
DLLGITDHHDAPRPQQGADGRLRHLLTSFIDEDPADRAGVETVELPGKGGEGCQANRPLQNKRASS